MYLYESGQRASIDFQQYLMETTSSKRIRIRTMKMTSTNCPIVVRIALVVYDKSSYLYSVSMKK